MKFKKLLKTTIIVFVVLGVIGASYIFLKNRSVQKKTPQGGKYVNNEVHDYDYR